MGIERRQLFVLISVAIAVAVYLAYARNGQRRQSRKPGAEPALLLLVLRRLGVSRLARLVLEGVAAEAGWGRGGGGRVGGVGIPGGEQSAREHRGE